MLDFDVEPVVGVLKQDQQALHFALVLVKLNEDGNLGEQDRVVDRLLHVVDRASLVAFEAVLIALVGGGEKDDRDPAGALLPAHQLGYLVAVNVGHLHVEQHHSEVVVQGQSQCFVARSGGDHLGVHLGEQALQGSQIGREVVNDEDLRLRQRGGEKGRRHRFAPCFADPAASASRWAGMSWVLRMLSAVPASMAERGMVSAKAPSGSSTMP